MRHIIDINPAQSSYQKNAGTDFISKMSLTSIAKSLTQSLTQIKKALEGKFQEP
jgi:hypothetical protein